MLKRLNAYKIATTVITIVQNSPKRSTKLLPYFVVLCTCPSQSQNDYIFVDFFEFGGQPLKNSLWMDVCIVGLAGQLLVVVSQLLSSSGDQYQVIPTSPIKNCIRDIRRETRIFSVFHENFPHLLAVAIFIIFMLKKRPTNRPSIQAIVRGNLPGDQARPSNCSFDRPTVRSSLCGEKINEEFNLI